MLRLSKSLSGGKHVLFLKIQKAGAGYFVKKNLWTIFGGMPLFHMGGASVSFLLFGGKPGMVETNAVDPVYGGFVKSKSVSKKIKNMLK